MAAPRDARELLDPERVVIFDGAMGTMLYSRGVFINQCYDELNLRVPELVREVHDAYVSAGAEVLETNSFGANRLKLAQYGLESQVEAINQRAAELARAAAGVRLLLHRIREDANEELLARSLGRRRPKCPSPNCA